MTAMSKWWTLLAAVLALTLLDCRIGYDEDFSLDYDPCFEGEYRHCYPSISECRQEMRLLVTEERGVLSITGYWFRPPEAPNESTSGQVDVGTSNHVRLYRFPLPLLARVEGVWDHVSFEGNVHAEPDVGGSYAEGTYTLYFETRDDGQSATLEIPSMLAGVHFYHVDGQCSDERSLYIWWYQDPDDPACEESTALACLDLYEYFIATKVSRP